MNPQKLTSTKYKILFSLLVLTLLFYVVLAIYIRPSIYSDPAWGFLTMNSMLQGSDFNYNITPNHLNINADTTLFNGVWTPGQYIIPYFLIKFFNLSLGSSIIITTSLLSIIGLIGYFKLFKHLQFSENICRISILFIVFQRYFSFPFSIYNGGEIMLFAGVPWIILFSLKMKQLHFWQLPLIIGLGLIGFFLKSTFIISFYAVGLCLLFINYKSQLFEKEMVVKSLKLFAIMLITTWLCYYFFIRYGLDSTPNNFKFNLLESVFTFCTGIGSALSLGEVFKRIFEFPGNTFSVQEHYVYSIIYYLVFSIISFFLYIKIYQSPNFKLYKTILFSFLFCFTLAFLFFYNKESKISSTEMRHFRPLGLLLTPGIILICTNIKVKAWLRYSLISLITMSCLYGPLSFLQRKMTTYTHGAKSNQGFTQELIDKDALNFIYKIDKKADRNTLFYITSIDIAIEIKNARLITTQADFDDIEQLKKEKYLGTVKNLYILLPKKFESNGKAITILKSFKGYKRFIKTDLSSQYNLYTPAEDNKRLL